MALFDKALRIGEGKKFKAVREERRAHQRLRARARARVRRGAARALRRAARARARGRAASTTCCSSPSRVTREAAKRTLGQRHFDVQLIGGMVLHDGSIAEMKTGEGKTLTSTLPICPQRAHRRATRTATPAQGKGVHLVTVNDYLARRDALWMKPIYDLLGVTVGILQSDERDWDEKRAAYEADVTYGTNSEFGFDYLRDNLATDVAEKSQRGHGFAIVDEVDNILIDEARTPLIISGAPEQAADLYYQFAKLAPKMEPGKKPEGLEAKSKELRGRLRLRARREAQDRRGHRARRREGREVPRHRQHVQGRARQPGQPPPAGAQGRVALQARRRLRGDRRRGQDHRRVHRPHPRGPALVGGPAPGRRGQGGRGDPGGEPDGRHDHLPELLPPLRQARGHDRHGPHRGHRVHEDLRAAGGRDPHQPADGRARTTTTRSTRPRTASGPPSSREIEERNEKGQPVLVGTISVEVSELLSDAAEEERHRARGAQRQARARRARGRDHRRGRAAPARSRSPPTWPAAAWTSSSAATPSTSPRWRCASRSSSRAPPEYDKAWDETLPAVRGAGRARPRGR